MIIDANCERCGVAVRRQVCRSKPVRRFFCSKRCSAHTLSPRHGMWRSPEWTAWSAMKERCTLPRFQAEGSPYRGVRYAPEWADFETFLAHVGERPSPTHSLDRIDGSKGYEPGNVRWADKKVQSRNKSTRVLNVVAVCLMRHMRRRGATLSQLSHAFGTGVSYTSQVIRGVCWDRPFAELDAKPYDVRVLESLRRIRARRTGEP